VSKIDRKTIEEYQKILAADPKSKVFAVLAEAYRELGIIDQAENLARRGISNHPSYAPGFVVLGRVLMQRKLNDQAIAPLKKAVELSPDNLLAYQLLGEAYLALKQPKEALRSHKMAMFLNPQNERSRKVVQKLESITADEYEEDLFQMAPLKHSPAASHGATESPQRLYGKEMALSVVDALIVRNQMQKAREKLLELRQLHPGDSEIEQRFQLLGSESEKAETLRPQLSKEKLVIEEKIRRLRGILTALERV